MIRSWKYLLFLSLQILQKVILFAFEIFVIFVSFVSCQFNAISICASTEVVFFYRCSRGDVMGCGIQFPVDYVTPSSVTSDDDDDDDDDAPEYLDDDDAVRIDGIPG